MSDSTPRRPVYRTVGAIEETCSHGCTHEVVYVEVKHLAETGETRLYDNGYEQLQTSLLRDTQGRIYHQWVEIDYFNNVSYVRDGSNPRRFTPRLPSGPVRDLTGRPLRDNTPTGPAWSRDLAEAARKAQAARAAQRRSGRPEARR